MIPHYTAHKNEAGRWGFTTPAGDCFGAMSLAQAEREAELTRNQDKSIAAIDPACIAALVEHFEGEGAE